MANASHLEDKGIEKINLDDVFREISVSPWSEVGQLTRIGYKLAILLLIYLIEINVKRVDILREQDPSKAQEVAAQLERQRCQYEERCRQD